MSLEIVKSNSLSQAQKKQLFQLWNNEYPQQLGFSTISDFENYLRALGKPIHFIANDEVLEVVAWAFTFERENERWFAIIIDGSYQRKGLGTRLLGELKKDEIALYGWLTDHDNYKKSNGETYWSPKEFYLKNDFVFCESVRLETEKLSAIKIKWKLPKNNI